MIVAVGSERKSKQEAVRKAFSHYYKGFTVVGFKCDSGVAAQPMSDGEAIRGATNRALAAVKHGDIGVGIEAGMKKIAGRYLDTTWCAITDSTGFLTIGSAPFFEYPKAIVADALRGTEVSVAAAKLFNVKESELKESGVIGELTNQVLPRTDYNSLAVLMALAPRLHKELF